MDASAFLQVEYGDEVDLVEDDEPLTDLTEDDIVLLDNEYEDTTTLGSKRPPPNIGVPPPLKKIKKTIPSAPSPKVHMNSKFTPASSNPHSPHLNNKVKPQPAGPMNVLKGTQLTVTRKPGMTNNSPGPGSNHQQQQSVKPRLPQQSITWKYRALGENQYTADIRKSEMLKDYEPEQCSCKRPEEGQSPCGSGCINRSTYSECELGSCINGEKCSNMVIQKRMYAPGLERFMTAKKGWGVRARQSIAKNSFILEYTGEICSKEEFERRMLVRYKVDNHHYCLAMDNKMMIDAHRAGSECRFVNHSCAPNCEMQKWTVQGLPRMGLFALKDILPGEEICYDYNFSLFNTDQGQECKCGAKDCRGIIGGKNKDFLITLDGDDNDTASNKTSSKPSQQNHKLPNTRTVEDEKWFAEMVSAEDMAWIEKNAPKPPQLEAKTIKCTVCNDYLDFKVQSQCQRHPDLGVILCSKCKSQYGRGGWDKDKEGNDEFCRWCSEGGQIYLCDFCPHAFCNKCLRWNLGRKYLKNVEEEEKWKCLICDPSYLREHRALYWAIFKYHKEKKPKAGAVNNSVSSPMKQGKSNVANTNSSAAAKCKTPVNSNIKSNGQVNHQKGLPNPKSVESVYKKLQENNFVTVSPVNKNSSKPGLNIKMKGVAPTNHKPVVDDSKHFVDLLLKDADDCVQQMVYMIGEARKAWKLSGKKAKDIPVVAGKLRKALELTKSNIDEVDKKVVGSCFKSSNNEATPCKSEVNGVVSNGKVKSTSAKKVEADVKVEKCNNEEEEGIHDVSVDELEIAANVQDEIYNTPKKKPKEEMEAETELETNIDSSTVKSTIEEQDFVDKVETNIAEPKDEMEEEKVNEEVPSDGNGSSDNSEVEETDKGSVLENNTGESNEQSQDNGSGNTEIEDAPKSEKSIETNEIDENVEQNSNLENVHNEVEDENVKEEIEKAKEGFKKSRDNDKESVEEESNVNEIEDSIENNLAVEVQ